MVHLPNWLKKAATNAIPFQGGPRDGQSQPYLPGPGTSPIREIPADGGDYQLQGAGLGSWYYEWVLTVEAVDDAEETEVIEQPGDEGPPRSALPPSEN